MNAATSLLLPIIGLLATPLFGEEITILAINDIHAKLGRIPRLATAVKTERRKSPDLLLLSAGDNIKGDQADASSILFYRCPMTVLMNRIGFDLSNFGNHEFDGGPEAMQKRLEAANFRHVCANVYALPGNNMKFAPYQIFEINGIKVAVLGLVDVTGKGVPGGCSEELKKHFRFRPAREVLPEYRHLREQCNILILLTHTGDAADVELAKQFPEADAIIGAHTHALFTEGLRVGNVMVTQAGSNCQHLTRLVFNVENGKVVSSCATTLDLSSYEPDPEIDRTVREYQLHSFVKLVSEKWPRWAMIWGLPAACAIGIGVFLYRRQRARRAGIIAAKHCGQ